MNSNTMFLVGAVASILAVVGSAITAGMTTIKGSELGVEESFFSGVSEVPLTPKTYVYNNLKTDIYHYDMTSRSFNMSEDEVDPKGQPVDGSYALQSRDSQDMHLSLVMRWRFDPEKIVQIHKMYNAHTSSPDDTMDNKLIAPTVMRIVKDRATRVNAIEAYAGETLVKLQQEIESDLLSPDLDLRQHGIIVESFVIKKVRLQPEYVKQITDRQISQMSQLKEQQAKLTALAAADTAKAEAQADLNRQVVGAQRDKEIAILKAEQQAEMTRIAVEAEKNQTTLRAEADASKIKISAEAEKLAAEARASAVTALGKAEAEAARLRYSAYDSAGGRIWAQIEASRYMSEAFRGIDGYIPENMNISVLSESWMKGIRGITIPVNQTETVQSK